MSQERLLPNVPLSIELGSAQAASASVCESLGFAFQGSSWLGTLPDSIRRQGAVNKESWPPWMWLGCVKSFRGT